MMAEVKELVTVLLALQTMVVLLIDLASQEGIKKVFDLNTLEQELVFYRLSLNGVGDFLRCL